MLAARRAVPGALLAVAAFLAIFGAAFRMPIPPATGPDPSWMVALGEALRDHFAFGRDIIYTYGPLGYLEVPGAVPHTYAAKTLFALAIACASAFLVLVRARSEGALWQRVAFVLGALIVFPYTNALYYVGEGDYQIFMVLILLFTLPALRAEKPVRLIGLLLGLLGGFCSLIKFSLFVSVLVVGAGIFAARILEHRRLPELRGADIEAASLYVLGFAVSSAGIYYWVTCGLCYETGLAAFGAASALCWVARSREKGDFLVSSLPVWVYVLIAALSAAVVVASSPYRDFLYYSLQIAAGYSSAVSREARTNEVWMGLLFLTMGTLLAIRERAALGAARLFAVIAVLFVAFKQAFVRQDPTHTIPFFLIVSFVGCILLLIAAQRRSSIYAAFLVALSLPVLPAVTNYGPVDIRNVIFPEAVPDGLQAAFQTIGGWRQNYEALAENGRLWLKPDVLAPSVRHTIGTEPVDLVGTEVSIVFANNLAWRPRPAFHAPYSVFTPALDAWNRDSIRAGKTGRELLTYESIDGRYPFGDEPLTTRELLCNYTTDANFPPLVATVGGTILTVLRQAPGRCGASTLNRLGTIGWNEWLRVSAAPGRLAFLFIDFRYSLVGRAAKTLYEIGPVSMVVRYRSGFTANYRVLPELLRGGLLVNPIPRDMPGVRGLFGGRNADPVDAIQFTTRTGWLFSPTMQYRLSAVPYS
jgi:hypothetical protein